AAACPDTGDYWVNLGSMRVHLGQRDGAKAAYKGALAAYEAEAAKTPTDPQPMIQRATVLALLGRSEEARSLLAKLPKLFPDNRSVQGLDDKVLDRLRADPKFKEIAL